MAAPAQMTGAALAGQDAPKISSGQYRRATSRLRVREVLQHAYFGHTYDLLSHCEALMVHLHGLCMLH